jgi:predicted RNA methylase
MTMITHKLDSDVVAVLKASTITGNKLILPANLDRKLYEKVNNAITMIGGKWNRGAKGHVFAVEGDEIKRLWGEAIETGEVVDKKKTFQFYQTPATLAKRMMSIIGIDTSIQDGSTILEPSAGCGAILDVLRLSLHDINKVTITAIEIDPEKCDVLRKKGYDPVPADFIAGDHVATTKEYDYIIANPPFAKKQDALHILRMWKLLKPGGSMVSVASAGIKTNSDKSSKAIQILVEESGGFFLPVPEGTFSGEGTNVQTCLVYLWKAK